MSTAYQKILEYIITTHEAALFQDALTEVTGALYNLKATVQKDIEKVFSDEVGQEILTQIKKQGIDLKDVQNVQNFLNNLKEELDRTPKVLITFAFDPSISFLKKVSDYLNESAGKHCIIEKSYDPTIVGGVQIVFNNIYKDYSLGKKIDEYKINF